MESLYSYIVVSKLNNAVKHITAVDKFHAVNKALYYFADHSVNDLKILKKLDYAKKR